MKSNNETTVQFMKRKGFTFIGAGENLNGTHFTFVNDEHIICNVYVGKRYEFIYTNSEMVGLLESGVMENLFNEGLFEQIYIQFKEAANVLNIQFEGDKL